MPRTSHIVLQPVDWLEGGGDSVKIPTGQKVTIGRGPFMQVLITLLKGLWGSRFQFHIVYLLCIY